MKRIAIATQAPHPWPFSHGVVVEGPARLVFLAGQVAWDRHGPGRQLVGVGDPAAQARQVFENIRTLLRQAGGDLEHVVEMTVYATSVELMGPAGRVAQEYFTDPLPAQSYIVVQALARPEFLVEIRAIAAIPMPRPRRQGRARPAAGRRPRARRT